MLNPLQQLSGARRRMSLVTQLLLLVGVLSLGPLLVTNLIGYERSRSDIQSLAIQSLQSSAKVGAIQTRVFLDEKRNLLPSLVAGNEFLRDSMSVATERLDNGLGRIDKGGLHQHLAAKVEQTEHASEFYVLAPDAKVLGSSDPGAELGEPRAGDSCSSVSGPEGAMATMDYAGLEPVLVVAAPISGSEGEMLGTFCARFDFELQRELQASASAQSPHKHIAIIDGEGRAVCGCASGHHPSAPTPHRLAEASEQHQPWAGRYAADGGGPAPLGDVAHGHDATEGHDGEPAASDSEDDNYLAAIAPVDGTDWLVVADLPEREALATLEELKERVIWMGGGFALLVILGIGFTVRKTALPIKDLVEATREMKDGRLSQRVEARGTREVAELTEVFNAMSQHVSNLHENLEDRVAERTTQLQKRTDELRRNQTFSELLFNSMSENLLVIDTSFTITKANESALQTYGEDIVGQTCHKIFEDCETPCSSCGVARVFDSREPLSVEQVHKREDRSEIMEMEIFPLPTDDNEPAKVLMVSRQVTEEKSQQAQMAHHEKMSAFALLSAGIAHEIGNPLSSIKAQLRLASELDDPEYTAETLEVIDGEVDRISRLLRQIVTFARRRQTEQTLVSWNQVVEDGVRLLQHDPRSRQVAIETDLADDLPPVRADEDRMLQILLNLGLNGVDAVDGQGTVTLQTSVEDGQVCMRVRDTGPGVPPEVRERIFEPYFTTKSSKKGTGLGLFVSRRIVEELGGTLSLESGDGGATFLLCMPVADTSRAALREDIRNSRAKGSR